MRKKSLNGIEIRGLSFSYGSLPLLQNASLEVAPGEWIGVIGPNGGGKTTLLKLLMGFLEPRAGHISLFGLSPLEARLKIGYVPQIHRIDRDFPITLLEQVLLGALSETDLFGRYPKEIVERALELLEDLKLSPHRNAPFASLSGGQAQRALFARALLKNPDLLLLDEPTANIDPPSCTLLLEKLEALKGKKTILLVTHDLKTIVEKVDRIVCVQGGELTSFKANEVCEHFALGLYHTPLSPGVRSAFPLH